MTLLKKLGRRNTYIAVMVAWILVVLAVNQWVYDIHWLPTIGLLYFPVGFFVGLTLVTLAFPRLAWESD